MTDSINQLPLDEASRTALAGEGLRYALVDTADENAHGMWLQADYRGFHFDAFSDAQLAEYHAALAGYRTIGVWDDTAAEPRMPVATVSSWRSPLSLPYGSSVEGWAISSVTVASTHRRRGIARALLEGELRAAHGAGIPLAMLTVSEATIYGRWGFGPAAWTAEYRIDTRGLRWCGPTSAGRVHQVGTAELRPRAAALTARAHERDAGEIPAGEHHWDRVFAISARTASHAPKLRAARYDDAQGEPQGFALYSVAEDPADFAAHTLTVEYLSAASDEAYAALWRYLLDQDLVTTVVAGLRPVDEPLLWMVDDPRAVRTTARREHLWLRILDVPEALAARRYAAADTVLLRLDDPLGFAAGDWMLATDATGSATVTPVRGDADADVASIALGVDALGSLLLGGVSAEVLRQAGRLVEQSPGAAARLDALFRAPRAPHLSIWF